MESIPATRTELLALRDRIGVAQRSRELLEHKRERLRAEFGEAAEALLRRSDDLERAASAAREALFEAEAHDGPEGVRSAALAAERDISFEARPASVMGVAFATIEPRPLGRPVTGRGFSLSGSSAAIDGAAAAFESEVELLLQTAAQELRTRRLADALSRTTRRINALDTLVLPRWRGELRKIQTVLDERERQDAFRLRRLRAAGGGRRRRW